MAVNRLSGMASGLDTDTMIKDLMKAEGYKLDRFRQQKQTIQWKRQAFLDINSKVYSLKTKTFDMKLTTGYKLYESSLSSNSTIKVSAGGDVLEGTYKITVDSEATSASRTSTATLSKPLEGKDAVTDLNLSYKFFEMTYNGVKKGIFFGPSDGDFSSGGIDDLKVALQKKINDAFGTNQVDVNVSADNKISFTAHNPTFKPQISVSVPDTIIASENALTNLQMTNGQASQMSLSSKLADLELSTGTLDFESDMVDFDINGVNFKISKNDTLGDIIYKINTNKYADVTASYDMLTDKLILKRKSTGEGKDITVVDNGNSNFMSKLGLTGAGAFKSGTNAKITVVDPNNSTLSNIEMPTNDFTLKGLTISIIDAKPGEVQTVSIAKNTNGILDNIKGFVTQYNETLDLINGELSKEIYKNYKPLTDEERSKLSADQIKQWEEYAKSGILRNDSTLRSVVTDMRRTIMSMISSLDANADSLAEIGITNVPYNANPKDYGKIKIDENKLKKAISEDLDGVIKIFANSPMDVKGQQLSNNIDLEGKDFKLTINGIQETISLSGNYDISTPTGKSDFLKNIQEEIDKKFGLGKLIVTTTSNNSLTFISSKGYSYSINSGTMDALPILGLTDNMIYNSDEKGIASKLYDKLNIGLDNIMSKAGISVSQYDNSILGKELYNLNSSITKEEERLSQVEKRYYKKFAAMETALNRMNSQSAWLSQQFASK